jgi:5-(carboxyamino)imidazole ribonucleotide mutase
MVVIIAGSSVDEDWIKKIGNELTKENIYFVYHIASAHKNTMQVMQLLDKYNNYKDRNIVFVTIAGRSNALGGVVSANSKYPVINCPPYKDKIDMMVNINSSIQNPSNVPVSLILEPSNIALFVKKIFAM